MKDKESIYDEHIADLMTKIIDVCKQNEIPFFCDFQLTEIDEENERSGLFCTTAVFDYDWVDKEKFKKYLDIGRPKKNFHAFVLHVKDALEHDGKGEDE